LLALKKTFFDKSRGQTKVGNKTTEGSVIFNF